MIIGTESERSPVKDVLNQEELPRERGEAVVVSAPARRVHVTASIAGAAHPTESCTNAQDDGLPMLDPDPATGCKRYFQAIAARDLESVLEAMTPEYGRQLSGMRRLPEFGAFFSLWCESQGRLVSVISSSIRGDCGSAALETDSAVVFAKLRRIGGRWLIDSEQLERARKVSTFLGAKGRS